MKAIKAENLSKAYQLGEIGTGTLSRDLERWVAKVRGKEDPFLTIGEANDRTCKSTSGVVWSLKDINFEIEEGDAVGIIGRNGAGKSTLLKLLSRVTSPTTGNIKVKGRIASLLEVGTGFHPELTGRENIYLNGTILGMRKKEIAREFDEIVNFSGVERYIDTPVKRYSSGMYVRLAFAVAAYLESEILIVDEVLAVGDAEFQKKCLGKMRDVSGGEGRTVLFVSHNMVAMQTLCNKGLLLANGALIYQNNMEACVNHYMTENITKSAVYSNRNGVGNFIKELKIVNDKGEQVNVVRSSENVYLEIAISNTDSKGLNFGFTLFTDQGLALMSKLMNDDVYDVPIGLSKYRLKLVTENLKSGNYYIEGALWDSLNLYEKKDDYIYFEYLAIDKKGQDLLGVMLIHSKWENVYE